MLQEGQEHAVMLYTWRCCSRAIPQPKSNEQPNRVEIYEKTVQVLAPEVNKLLNFMYFQVRIILIVLKSTFFQYINPSIFHSVKPLSGSALKWSVSHTLKSARISYRKPIFWRSANLSTCLQCWMNWKTWNRVSKTTIPLTVGEFILPFYLYCQFCLLILSICRAAQFLKVMTDQQALQESQNLSMFLATQNKIRDSLKEALEKIPA